MIELQTEAGKSPDEIAADHPTPSELLYAGGAESLGSHGREFRSGSRTPVTFKNVPPFVTSSIGPRRGVCGQNLLDGTIRTG